MPDSISSKSASTKREVNFLTLPLEIRNNIYKHIFALSHPIYIFQDNPGSRTDRIESFAPRRNRHWSALLYTNRQISAEARIVLYGGNEFSLMEMNQAPCLLLSSFLGCIGSANAGSLSYLCMNFPAIERIDKEDEQRDQSMKKIRIKHDGLLKLQVLRKECTGLRVLETLVYSDLIGDTVTTTTGVEVLQGILEEINEYFRSIPSLRSIIVRIVDGSLHSSVRDLMQDLGWIVLLSGL